MENKKLMKHFALIGSGQIAQTHKIAVQANNQCKIVAVVDVDQGRATAMAEQCKCKAYFDYNDVLSLSNLDCVIIATPPNDHYEIALKFIKKGIHVLCEKPITMNSDETRELNSIANKKEVVLMMSAKFRYVDDVIKAKSIIESGILGEIIHFENVFCSKVDMTARWNSDPNISGGGVLMDNGCHSVDIVRYLFGPIKKVLAIDGKKGQNITVEDTIHLFLKTEENVTGTINLSWSIHKSMENYIEVYGTFGMLTIGWKGSKYRQSENLDWVKFGDGYNKINAFQNQLINFIGCINRTDVPLITTKDALQSVRVIEVAYKSKKTSKWQEV